MCALLGLMGSLRWDGHIEAGAMMNGCGWVDGLGWGCGLGSGLGGVGVSGVEIVQGEL